MAGAESDGGWWSNLLTAAKEKSVSALSATKRDLAEFVSVVSNDTSVAVKNASDNIKGLMQHETPGDSPKQTKSTLSHHLTSSTTSSSSPPLPPSHPVGVPYDRSQAQLFSLQNSPDTFLTDPQGAGSEYKKWAEQFDVQSRQAEISQLLVNCPHVRSLHGQLVPAKVSYNDFWKRYFFKLSLLQQEEQRRADLMARVQPQPPPEDLAWEELEETLDEVEEEEKESEGGKEGREEERQAEDAGGSKNGQGRNKDPHNREDDVASSIVEIKSDHLRSESSDSFVCVSEDLPPSDQSHASPDENGGGGGGGGGGDWEYLKMMGGEEVEGGEGGGGGGESRDLTVTSVKQDGGGEGEKERGEEKEASEGSDWESWDD